MDGGMLFAVCLLWYAVGLSASGAATYQDWSRGADVTGADLVFALAVAVFGPILWAVTLLFFMETHLSRMIDGWLDKTLIKGRRTED